jgi:hypothetical protein
LTQRLGYIYKPLQAFCIIINTLKNIFMTQDSIFLSEASNHGFEINLYSYDK